MLPDSPLARFWTMVKPPPPAIRPMDPKVAGQKRRQRRLVMATVAAAILAAGGFGIYTYVAASPSRAQKEFEEGMRYMGPGRYPEAIVHLTRALSIYSQMPEAYVERGNAHRSLGESDAALADFQAAVDLNPTLADAHNGIAMIYVERHDQRRALEELNKSLSLKPTVEAYFQRGQILEAQGDHKKAIEDYDRAIGEAPDAPYMYRARALAKINLGDEQGAHADREIALRLEYH